MSTAGPVVVFSSQTHHFRFKNKKEISGVNIEWRTELRKEVPFLQNAEAKIRVNTMFNYSPKSFLKYAFDQAI